MPLVLLRAVELPTYDVDDLWMAPVVDYQKLMDTFHDVSDTYLREVAERLRGKGAIVSTEVSTGFPATEIDKYIQEHPGSVVVMTTHGRTGLVGMLLGSVARRVVQRLDTPVVLIRPTESFI